MKIMEGITPLPWEDDMDSVYGVEDYESRAVASTYGATGIQAFSNAAYIAHACNMFPELVEALELAKENVEHWGAYADDYYKEKWDLEGDIQRLEEVITRAKGEVP